MTVLVTDETVFVLTALTMPVIAENVLPAAAWPAGPSWIGGCGPVVEPWIAWAALLAMPMAAGEVGDGPLGGELAVTALTVPVTADRASAAVGWLARL